MIGKILRKELGKQHCEAIWTRHVPVAASVCAIQGIMPPHILREIMQRGEPEQRAWALRTLITSAQLRGRREAIGAFAIMVPAGVKRRTIYDAKNGEYLPGSLVRGEGDPPTKDPEVTEAYDGAGATYDLYKEVYGRNSIDDRGMRLDSTVHYGQNYDNAFWNGTQMVYGDGDGVIFQRFSKSIDVIGHELTHGVTQYTAALAYSDQSGALNESMSDVFGSLVKQRTLGQTANQADWLIGAGLLAPKRKGVALRSMKAPGTAYDDDLLGKDPQPGHMKDYLDAQKLEEKYQDPNFDSGGVHENSGIPNHAFYLVATEIGGNAWEKAGLIWFTALTKLFRSSETFQTAANKTFKAANELFPGGPEQKAVLNGWAGVGITVQNTP